MSVRNETKDENTDWFVRVCAHGQYQSTTGKFFVRHSIGLINVLQRATLLAGTINL